MLSQNQPNRREWLRLAGLLAAERAFAKPLGIAVGMQPYTIRAELIQDFEGSLHKVKEIGYEVIETGDPFYGKQAAETRRVLDACGLPSPSGYYDYPADDADWSKKIEAALLLKNRYMVTPVPEDWRKTLDGWHRAADRFNQLGAQCREAGITLTYHNHNFEFRMFDGKVAYDEFLRLTDPQLVQMEMDCFWTVFAGRDPVDYFHRYPGRFPLLHIKDLKKGFGPSLDRPKDENPFTEVGSGVIPYPRILQAARSGGLKHYYVEQDRCDRPPFESARISCEYLRRLQVPRA